MIRWRPLGNSSKFLSKTHQLLQQQPIRRKAEILPVGMAYHQDKKAEFYSTLAQNIIDGAVRFASLLSYC